jgi:hypothetical protein
MGGGQWIAIESRLVPVLHAAGDGSMTLFYDWTKKFSVGLAVLACGQTAKADGGAFKPASFGRMVDEAAAVEPAPTYAIPASMQEAYPGQYCEPSTCGEYIQGCDASGCGPGCGIGGGMLGHHFGAGCGTGGGPGMGMGCGPGDCYGEGEACGYCGNAGCAMAGGCLGHGRSLSYCVNNLLGKLSGMSFNLAPYGEGGVATPRWYDISVEMMALRQSNGARSIPLTSLGQAGPIVLSTGDANLDTLEPGLAMTIAVQTGVGSNIEFVYNGLNEWEERAQATSNAPNLYSYISSFGLLPVNGFDDTDRSFLQSATYNSKLHNGEFNFRRRWSEPAGFLQGSFLAGIRYLDLDEQLVYSARGENNNGLNNGRRFADFSTETRNQLVGFQLGTDLWWNVIPGVKIGSEIKSGVFGNNSEQATVLQSNSIDAFGATTQNLLINETSHDGRTAYITSFNTQLYYRLSYSWAFKTSYQLIYVDNVALAPENINTVPVAQAVARANSVPMDNDGEVLYTGYTLGAEYTW